MITGKHPSHFYDFFEKLAFSIQALDTMNKIKDINGNIRIILDKLPDVLKDLVKLDNDWQDGPIQKY